MSPAVMDVFILSVHPSTAFPADPLDPPRLSCGLEPSLPRPPPLPPDLADPPPLPPPDPPPFA